MERVILVSPEKETSEDFTTHFNHNLELKENSMIALKSLSMLNSWHNISSEYNNNNKIKFSKDNGITYETLLFVNGNYTITDINNYLFSHFEVTDMKDLPFIFGIYTPTGKFGITFNPNVNVDFKEGNINQLLGFNEDVYLRAKEKNVVAENYGNISKGIDTIQIHCNIIKDSWYGSMKVNNLLYEFTPTEKPYSQIIIKERDPEFIRMHTNNISSIRMWVTDQTGYNINLNKFPVRYKLLIKQ